MKLDKKNCTIETMRGTGPGGQHKNKKDTAVRITHKPTGISAYCDERSQAQSKKQAWKELKNKLSKLKKESQAKIKKLKRDEAIHNTRTVRTYDYKSGLVINHVNGKSASIKDVLIKGKINLLH